MLTQDFFFELSKTNVIVSILLALVLMFVKTPKIASLEGYKKTKPAIIVSFLLIGFVNSLEVADHHGIHNRDFVILITLIVASYQIFLFSSTIITMLDLNHISKKRCMKEMIPTTFLSAFGIMTYHLTDKKMLNLFFVLFAVYFTTQIIRFTIQYLRTERAAIQKLDNFFSEETSRSVQWTRAAFVGMFFCSIFTLASLVHYLPLTMVFIVCYTTYYIYFTIHYLNYVNLFLDLIPALEQTAETTIHTKSANKSFDQLEKAIIEWESTKRFTETGLNIEQVAQALNTNRTYLSNHMNLHRNQTFKDWINHLRIEEAKQLMKAQPDIPVAQIGVQVGIPDKSNFGRQFTRITGMSPNKWRKK